MRIPVPPLRPWEFTRDDVDLIKNMMCRGATDEEFKLMMAIARRTRMDPIRGQIYFIPYGKDKKKTWKTIVGINGLLHIAARDHADFGSIEEPEYGPMTTINWKFYDRTGKLEAPEWARVKVFKKGSDRATSATVWFKEIYSDAAIANSDMVRAKPRLMIGKVATAHAVRKAWPATDNLYLREEYQEPPQYTEGGRRIEYPDAIPVAPQLNEDAAHGHVPGSKGANMAEAALKRVETADAELKASKAKKPAEAEIVDPGAPVQEGRPPRGSVELDLTADPAFLRGDIGDLIPLIKEHTKAYWDGDAGWWRVPAGDLDTIRAMCKQCNYELREVQANRAQAPPKKAGRSADPGASSEPKLCTVTVERINIVLRGKKAMAYLTLQDSKKKKVDVGCFDKDIYTRLEKVNGKGIACQVYLAQRSNYINLVGLKFIGSQEFVDGKVPVVAKDREPGKTLYD